MIRKYYGVQDNLKYGEEFMSRFPILFQYRNKSMQETCMCWGIECPIGWYHILEQLCTILEFHNIEFTKNHGLAIIADQVKEKFGTLRFYYTVREVDKDGVEKVPETTDDSRISTEENKHRILMDYLEMLADKYIDEAEDMTAKTCARCGIPLDKDNMVETQGWISYICKECNEKQHKEWDEEYEKMKGEKCCKEPKEDEDEPDPPPNWDEDADKAFLDEHAEKTNILVGKTEEFLEKFPPHSRMRD